MSQQLFSSESVTEGHPDKVCDRISDAILDALLDVDPRSRVAVETMAATGLIHVAGEVTTEAYVEIPEIVRREILSIGYDSSRVGFDGASCGVSISLDGQSPDIAGGVDEALEVRGTDGGDPRDDVFPRRLQRAVVPAGIRLVRLQGGAHGAAHHVVPLDVPAHARGSDPDVRLEGARPALDSERCSDGCTDVLVRYRLRGDAHVWKRPFDRHECHMEASLGQEGDGLLP